MLFLLGLEIRNMELWGHFIKDVDDNYKIFGNVCR